MVRQGFVQAGHVMLKQSCSHNRPTGAIGSCGTARDMSRLHKALHQTKHGKTSH